MLDRFLYYCVFIPWGHMPLALIYLVSDFFYFIIRFIIPYRKKVILENIKNSFPEKSEKEQKQIAKKFYRFFANLFAESIKNLFISEKNLRKRIVVRNPEIMDDLYKEGRSVLFLSSHFNNWEFLITAQSLLFDFQAIGIGTPLSNKFWDAKINARRERFGMKVVNAKNYKEVITNYKDKPTATLILGDQNPGKNENCYWTKFLNQETAFFFGAEVLANEFDMPVIYASIQRLSRGKYELVLELISKTPREETYGAITSNYISILEKDIISNPEYWLWSHKRWKKTVPENIDEIKKNHKERFISKFRTSEVKSEQ